jgi:hypothetical protein
VTDARTKSGRVRACLNDAYYEEASPTANSFLGGSWGKKTMIRPPRDIDVFFVLPPGVHGRFERRAGNRQSQLLQEVKSVLEATFTTTRMRGDGQVVVVPFLSYGVEVVPAFAMYDGSHLICDTHDGGRYKTVRPDAEIARIESSDSVRNGNTRALIRMMKRWQGECLVPLKSFWIEILVVDFLDRWEHASKSEVYYDWMVRDFFAFLVCKRHAYIFVPGTYEMINLGDAWCSRAETALARAQRATAFESASDAYAAGVEWQKIFGSDIPIY